MDLPTSIMIEFVLQFMLSQLLFGKSNSILNIENSSVGSVQPKYNDGICVNYQDLFINTSLTLKTHYLDTKLPEATYYPITTNISQNLQNQYGQYVKYQCSSYKDKYSCENKIIGCTWEFFWCDKQTTKTQSTTVIPESILKNKCTNYQNEYRCMTLGENCVWKSGIFNWFTFSYKGSKCLTVYSDCSRNTKRITCRRAKDCSWTLTAGCMPMYELCSMYSKIFCQLKSGCEWINGKCCNTTGNSCASTAYIYYDMNSTLKPDILFSLHTTPAFKELGTITSALNMNSTIIYNSSDLHANILNLNCSHLTKKSLCQQTQNCVWEREYFSWINLGFAGNLCHEVSQECPLNIIALTCNAAQSCVWDSFGCWRFNEQCAGNIKSICLKKNGCYWNKHLLYCEEIPDYRMECSGYFNDITYTGTRNMTCDHMPCVKWSSLIGVDVHVYSSYESLVDSHNYCRNPIDKFRGIYRFHTAWCYVSIDKNTAIPNDHDSSLQSFDRETIFIPKPCCVPLCPSKNTAKRSKCVFTVRGHYEYSGKENITCTRNKCIEWSSLFGYEGYRRSKFHQSILTQYSLYDFAVDGSINESSNYCRNPGLRNDGEGCYILDHFGAPEYEVCCSPPCEEDDQVTCMWTQSGTEYSGRIDTTCSGMKCVPWSRSFHKFKKLNITLGPYHKYGILDRFPDRSIEEAANYCRNPTRDECGPWCYTSLSDDSSERCCIPDCTAANKGGHAEAVGICQDNHVVLIQRTIQYIIDPALFVVGLTLNIFSYNVFRQAGLAHSTTSLLFRVLAIADSFTLVLGVGQDFINVLLNTNGVQNINYIFCKLYWPLRYLSWSYPTWVLILITIERYTCILHPLEATILCSRKWALKHLYIFGFTLLVVYSPNVYFKMKWKSAEKVYNFNGTRILSYTYKTRIGNCVSIPTEYWTHLIMICMVYIDFIVACLIPFVTMIMCNSLIINKVIQASTKRRNMTNSKSGPDVYNLTTTLLTVSFMFMLLSSPSAVLVLGWDFFGINSGHSTNTIKLWRSMAKMLLNMNSALNFVQYACTGQTFRQASKNLLKGIINVLKIKNMIKHEKNNM